MYNIYIYIHTIYAYVYNYTCMYWPFPFYGTLALAMYQSHGEVEP